MTAPATAQAPAAPAQSTPASAATVVEHVEQTRVEPSKPEGLDGIINRLVKKPLSPDMATELARTESEQGETAQGALESGARASMAPTDVVPPPAAALSGMVQEIVIDDPDGHVTVRSREADGRYTPMNQTQKHEIVIKDPTTGESKVYNKTLPELVRMAKDGIAMQRSRDELAYYRDNVPKWEQGHKAKETEVSSTKRELENFKALTHALLTDPPQEVDARRQEYARQFTPEARAAQLERENAALRQRVLTPPANKPTVQQPTSTGPTQQQVQALAQSVGQDITAIQGMVGEERMTGRIFKEMGPLYVNGQIPPDQFPRFEQYVKGPLKAWAQAEAAKAGSTSAEAAKTLEDARQVQIRAQQAARNTGAATRPSPISSGSSQPSQKPPKNLSERIDRIVRKAPQSA